MGHRSSSLRPESARGRAMMALPVDVAGPRPRPGDVGVPPRIKWSLPDGMRAGELLYSPPQQVKMGQVGAYGNYGETLFLCKFEPIVPLDVGTTVKISGKASWLACSRQCKPGLH